MRSSGRTSWVSVVSEVRMHFAADLRSALRSLIATRATTLAAIFTLALGTGAFSAVFAIVDGVLLKPLPYSAPDRLVVITTDRAVDGNDLTIPAAELPEWRRRLGSYEALAAYARGEFTVRGAGDPEVLRAAVVSGEFFDVFAARPDSGVPFRADDPRVVVISARYARRLAASGGVVGRVLNVGQIPYEVVAVMPATFAMPDDDVDLWMPLRAVPGVPGLGPGDRRSYRLVGRLRAGASIEQARDDASQTLSTMSGGGPGRRANVRLLEDLIIGTARPAVWALAAAGALLLLVACANVATLLVGRALARQREFAVRLSIGASRAGLVRASLFESAIVAGLASACGLWLAHFGLRAFALVAAEALPRLEMIAIDLRVVAVSVAVAAIISLACGLAPAVTAGRSDLATLLRRSPGAGGLPSRRLRSALVGAQLALAVMLLVGTGLLARTVWTLLGTDTGATTRNAVTTRLALTETTTFDAASRMQFVDELLRRVRELPEVIAAGIGSSLPPRTNQIEMTMRVVNEGRDQSYGLNLIAATPGFLPALGVRLISGRDLDARDAFSEQAAVAVVSEQFARHLSPDRELIDRDLPMSMPTAAGKRVQPRVIGVAASVRYRGLELPPQGNVYMPWWLLSTGSPYLVVRTAGDPQRLVPILTRIIRDLDPSLPLRPVHTLDEEMALAVESRSARLVVVGAIGVLAVCMAFFGLLTALARMVAERRRELAIRLALGETSAGAVRRVMWSGLRLVVVALVAGLAVSAAAGRALASVVYGISPYDPLTYVCASAGIIASGLIVCYVPARRATRIAPVELLRSE
jgi:putative ABC transport system permease protein